MNITYDHVLVASFISWFDNTLSNFGGAFCNTTGQLYPVSSDYYASRNLYSSSFKPWIYDQSISGAIIPSGVYDSNGNFLTRDSGIYFNFNEGWVGTTGVPLNAPLTASFSFKEFDIFYTNEDEDVFLDQTKFVLKPKTSQQIPITGLKASERTFPCAAIKYDPGENKNFAFGGTQNTVSEFRVLIVADSTFAVDGILSLFRDTRLSNFSLLNLSQLPLNSLGDYNNNIPFNYNNNISSNPEDFIWISDVTCIKLSDAFSSKIGQKLYTAMLDFTVERPRNMHLRFEPGNINYYYVTTEDNNFIITE